MFFPGGRHVGGGWSGATHGTEPTPGVSARLMQPEPMVPGVTAAYTGKAYRDFWRAAAAGNVTQLPAAAAAEVTGR